MKQLPAVIFILALSLSGFSQNSKTQPNKKTAKKIPQQSIIIAPVDTTAYQIIAEESKVVDTLRIQAGKPCLVLVNVYQYPTVGYNDHVEEKELIQNFGKDALQIIYIDQHTYVIFENGQTLDISDFENSYQAFAYWGGDLEDKVQTKEGTHYATEFVAEQMNVHKESSYVANTRKYKKEVASLENANNVTEKSRKTMNAFLSNLSIPFPDDKGEDAPLYEQKFTRLKSIETYFPEPNGKKILLKKIEFNKDQQPISVKNYNRKGNENGRTSLIFENGMLIKIIHGETSTTTIKYDDNQMILFSNAGDGNETTVAWIEKNDILLEKNYVLMFDDKYQYMNTYAEEKIENNCITRYLNSNLLTINYSTKTGTFPFVHKYTSFQDGKVLQFRKSKLVKTGEKQFEKYYSDAERESDKDNFKLFGVFQLNDQNLLSSYYFFKDGVKRKIKTDYTYFTEN